MRNRSVGMQNRYIRTYSLISLLLGGCRGVHTCVINIGAQCNAYVRAQYIWCIGTGVVWIRAYKFTDMGVLHFCYGRTTFTRSTFAFLSDVPYVCMSVHTYVSTYICIQRSSLAECQQSCPSVTSTSVYLLHSTSFFYIGSHHCSLGHQVSKGHCPSPSSGGTQSSSQRG